MTDNKQITNHFNYHTKRKFNNVCNNTSTCEESNLSMCLDFEVDTMSSISSFDLEDNTIVKKIEDDNLSEDVVEYTNEASYNFFNMYKTDTIGLEHMIKRSQQISTNSNGSITREDIELHLCFSRLSYNLGPSDRELLCKLIQSLITHVKMSTSHKDVNEPNALKVADKSETVQKTTIPITLSDVRKLYLEGKNAMITNLPTPVVYTTNCNHAYVRIKDVIEHFFAYGCCPELLSPMCVEMKQKVCYPSECKKARMILEDIEPLKGSEKNVFEVLLTDWHDDFEPNTQSKQNRGSVWILSITIVSSRNIKNAQQYTFPIAIGEKNSSHEVVMDIYNKDLSNIHANPIKVYDRENETYRKIRIVRLLSIADSPERRSSNYVKLGNGLYTARWGYSLNVNAKHNFIVSCNDCMNIMLQEELMPEEDKCLKCSNFSFNVSGPVSLDYPKTMLSKKDVYEIQGKQLTYEELIAATELAYNNIQSLVWTKKNTKEYLSALGLNEAFIKMFTKAADNNLPFQEIIPSKWKFNKGPLMLTHIDPLMHLIFYGVGSSTIEELQKFLIKTMLN